MKTRFMAAVWLSLVLLLTGLTAAWTQDPNASIVQGSPTGTALSVTGAVTSTVSGSVTANQGTAGVSPWSVDINNWLPYPWQITFNGVAQPVTAAQSGSWTVGISGTPTVLSTQSGAWTVGVNNFPSSFGVTQGTNPWTISGTVTTNQGTSPWLIGGTLTTNVGPPGANNLGTLSATANASAPTFTEGNQVALSTDLSGNLRVVTTGGNTVTQGTSPWIVGFNGVAQPVTVGNFPATQTVAGTVTANQGTSPWLVDGSAHTQPVSGTVTANAGSGTFTVGGTVTANQGTTPWVVDGSGAIQPVSGTVTANAGSGTFTVGGTVTANAGSGTFTVDGSGHTQPVSATSLPLPTGAATEATLATLPLAQGSTTSGQSGTLAQGAVTTAAPTYTTAKTSPLSLNTAGGLRVDGSGVTQPVSGTVTANAGSGTFTVGGTVTANAGSGTFTVDGSGHTQPVSGTVTANAGSGTFTVGGTVTANAGTGTFTVDGSGHTQPVSGTVTANQGGAPWSAVGTLTNNNATPSTTNVGTLPAKATAAAPTWTEGNQVTLSTDLSGSQRVSVTNTPTVTANAGSGTFTVDGSGHTQPVSGTVAATQSGTWTVQPGNTANTTAWKVDGSAVTQPVSGTVTANAGTGNFSTNVAQVNGSTVLTAASGIQKVGVVGNAGATVDSTVAAGTAPTNQVVVGTVYNTTAPAPTNGQAMALQSDQAGNHLIAPGVATGALSAWNSSTALNATQNIFTHSGAQSVLVQLTETTTLTAGAVTFEVTYDNSTWVTIPADCVLDPTSTQMTAISVPYTVEASTNKKFLLIVRGAQGLRVKLSTQITGTGTITPNYTLLPFSPVQQVSGVVQEDLVTGVTTLGVTGQAVTTSTAQTTVVSRTVTAGKTFYLCYVVMSGRFSTLSTTGAIMGTMTLTDTSNNLLMTDTFTNPTIEEPERIIIPLAVPLPFAAGDAVKVTCTAAGTTSTLWSASFGGYEK